MSVTHSQPATNGLRPPLRRQCGWYERIFVSTSNQGEPLYSTYAARIERPLEDVKAAALQRVAELVDKVAMLSARVGDVKTRHPYYLVPEQRRRPEDIVFTSQLSAGTRDSLREEVQSRALAHAEKTFDLESGRMWNVGLWESPSDNGQATYLSFTVLHVITDGLGGRYIFEALLSPTMPKHLVFLEGLPPTLEETIPYYLMGKTIRFLAWFGLSLLMPRPIRERMTWAPHWPLSIDTHPKTQPTARCNVQLDGSVGPHLKALAKKHNTGTINPVLVIAMLSAIFAVTAPEDKPDSNARLPFHLAVETPITVRQPEKLQHSSCVGNFSGSFVHQAQLRRTTGVWDHARVYAKGVKECDDQMSLQFLALSRLIPDSATYKPTPEAPTSWDAYILSEKKKPQPFRSTLDVVNLGVVHGPKGARVSEIILAGTIDQLYSAFLLAFSTLVSHEPDIPSSLGLTISWRQGCIPDETVPTVMENFRKVVALMISGRIGPDATFGQVTEMLKDKTVQPFPEPNFGSIKKGGGQASAAAPRESKL
ncbi:hypothetical protein OC846_003027 [Tilletia horrida]|uniref:Uncharacterized protein n=1 Tax=Tilletia horrida TaxID=155126 RepID=A0AAN6GPR5_9BASI|nr:hypothetical protein OC845_002744 [Tilletia horrida]KAK0552062.1 hypothetical protein OC846_003027 [Tilletia horrida]KAK0566787.1 hypothetical protein OC861_003066 [Tilletia horrida]